MNARGLPGRSRTHGIPPMRCIATSKTTGERCKLYAIVGATVCMWHGGWTGQVKRKAEERVMFAQLIERDRRHPWEVLLDMTHKLDVITQEYQAEMLAGETITADQFDRLIELARTAHTLAATAISTKAHEHVAMAFTRHLEMEGQLVASAVGAALDKLGLTEPWRAYALQVAHWTLAGEGDHERGDEPRPPDEPVVAEYDVQPRSAIEAGPTTGPVLCDVATLDDDALRDLGERVLDELGRRDVR